MDDGSAIAILIWARCPWCDSTDLGSDADFVYCLDCEWRELL